MNDAVLILATAPSRDEAVRIAQVLVEEKLAACVQLSGIESWYRWEGRTQRAVEVRLHIKTLATQAAAVAARITALHSYQVPEIVTLEISGGSDAYLAWIGDALA